MSTTSWWQTVGVLASVILPFSNIPLILRMVQRRSSQDISLLWLFGVYACLLLMVPVGWISSDPVFKIFVVVNVVLFSCVVFTVIWFRWKEWSRLHLDQKLDL